MKQKTIVQRYGKLAIYFVLALLVAVGTLQFMDSRKTKMRDEASSHFDSMLKMAKEKNFDKAIEEANILIKNYEKTPYAGLAAMMQAKVAIDQDKPKEAIESLRLAMRLDNNGPLQNIAKIRLARLLTSEGQYEEALSVLPQENIAVKNAEEKTAENENAHPNNQSPYTTLFEEIRGDIYFKQRELKKAKEAYARAMKAAPPGLPLTALQLKYTDLSVKEDS